jgi:hypothetical protein
MTVGQSKRFEIRVKTPDGSNFAGIVDIAGDDKVSGTNEVVSSDEHYVSKAFEKGRAAYAPMAPIQSVKDHIEVIELACKDSDGQEIKIGDRVTQEYIVTGVHIHPSAQEGEVRTVNLSLVTQPRKHDKTVVSTDVKKC